MKLLFIWPDFDTGVGNASLHIGLAYLSAVAKQAGHQTALIRISEEIDKAELYKRIDDFGPDLIGFSVTTNQFERCVNLADWIKEKYEVPILFGGHHPTLVPEEVIAAKSVDMLCRACRTEEITPT